MEEKKIFTINKKAALFRYLAWAVVAVSFLLLGLYVAIEQGFPQNIMIWVFLGTMLTGLIILPFLIFYKEVKILSGNVKIINLITKKEVIIPYNALREIKLVYIKASGRQPSQGPYVFFSFKNPEKKKLFDEEVINLNSFKEARELLVALSTIPVTHTYNGIKADFVDIANKWYPKAL